MSIRDESPLRIIAMGQIASRLLCVLHPYANDVKIPLDDGDYHRIDDIKQFLKYAIQGSDISQLFKYDTSFKFATPGSAFKDSLDILVWKIGLPKDVEEVKAKCNIYLDTLDKFQNGEKIPKETLQETITFLEGLHEKGEKTTHEKYFGVKYSKSILNPLSI